MDTFEEAMNAELTIKLKRRDAEAIANILSAMFNERQRIYFASPQDSVKAGSFRYACRAMEAWRKAAPQTIAQTYNGD